MKKKVIALLLSCAMCLGMVTCVAAAEEPTLDGSWYDKTKTEFCITTAAQLSYLRYLVNSGDDNFKDKTIILGADIDLSGETWNIGIGCTGEIGKETNAFQGTFDGDGHKIENLTYNSNSKDTYEGITVSGKLGHGLFGAIGKNGVVKNLALNGVDITAGNNTTGIENLSAAALCGVNMGEVNTCYVNDVIPKGGYKLGYTHHFYAGAVAYNIGEIDNVWLGNLTFDKNVLTPRVNSSAKGGVVAANEGTIKNCYAIKPTYNKDDTEFFKFDENGIGVSGSTVKFMFWYDPIVACNDWVSGKTGTVENVYSYDDYSYYHGNGANYKTYDRAQFKKITDGDDVDAVFDKIASGENPVDAIAYPKVTEFESSNGNKTVEVTFSCSIVWGVSYDKSNITLKSEGKQINIESCEIINDTQMNVNLSEGMGWNVPCTISFKNLSDNLGRTGDSDSDVFESGNRVSGEVGLDCVGGSATVTLADFKSEEGTPIEDAVLSLYLIRDGKLLRGINKTISISASAGPIDPVSISVTDAQEGDIIQAVLYKDAGCTAPLTHFNEIILQ